MMMNETIINLNLTEMLMPLAIIFILIVIMLFTLMIYIKARIFVLMLVIFSISLILGIQAISIPDLPFNPWFPILFMLWEFTFFLFTTLETFAKKY